MIRILLVDDQKVITEALQVVLELESDFQIVGTAQDGVTAIKKVAELQPDVVLIDMEMPGLNGADATQTITEKYTDTKVLVLSSHDRDEYVAKALSVGANGYLLKNAASKDIAAAIRSIYQGYSQLSPGLLKKISAQVDSALTVSQNTIPTVVDRHRGALDTKKAAAIAKTEPKEIEAVVEVAPKSSIWQRLLLGTTFVGLGIAGVALGSIALNYRLSNLVLENGTINGRVLRLRSPIDGKLEDFYPRPGVFVEPNQTLATIKSTAEPNDSIPALQAEIQSKSDRLLSAKQLLGFLESNLQQQTSQSDRVWQVEAKIDNGAVKQQQAAVEKAIAQANLARLDFERFNKLYQNGAIAKQKVDQARANWEVAQAEVKAAKEQLSSAQIALNASRQQIAAEHYANWNSNLTKETAQLKQQIVNQSLLINNLETELALAQQQLAQIQLRDRNSQQVAIKSPLAAVVYRTEREQGELIQQSEALLTLLDCNDIWVETVVKAQDATKIDFEQPVLVELAGEAEPIRGQVALIQAVSSQGEQERSQRLQSQALVPTISPNLVGKNLSRITVNIPPPSNHSQLNKFCGLGQPSRMTFATRNEFKLPQFITNQWQKVKQIPLFARKS